MYIGVARILSVGALFVPEKLTTFLIVALKLDSCSASGGCTLCLEGCTYNIPRKFGPEKNFLHLGGCTTPWLRLCLCATATLLLIT